MIKGKKVLYTVAMIIFIINSKVYSQNNMVVYFMKMPQNHLLNPAIKPSTLFYLGLPAVSGVSASVGNNFLALNDILVTGTKSDQTFTFQDPDFNLGQLTEKLRKNNTITAEGLLQLFSLGIPVGKNYTIFMDVNDRLAAKAVSPEQLMDLYISGPADFVNKTINISDVRITGQYFREYGLGFSGNVIKNLRIGGKFKLLSGMAAVSLDNQELSLTVNSDLSQTLTTNASLSLSGQETLNRIFEGSGSFSSFLSDYLLNPVINSGMALDLGAVYNLGKMFTLSASVTDLGYIDWTSELKSYSSSGTISLPGITMDDVVDQTFSIEDMIGALADTLKGNFIADNSPAPFRTNLPATILAGGSIDLAPFFSLGILSESRIYAGNLKQSFIFSGNFYAGRILSASISYTLANSSFDNLGLGLAVKTGPVQIYLIADKIPLSWDKVYIQDSGSNTYNGITLPSSMSMLSAQLGVNIAFGRTISKKTDKPMLLEEKKD
jgi:hypothetical protein